VRCGITRQHFHLIMKAVTSTLCLQQLSHSDRSRQSRTEPRYSHDHRGNTARYRNVTFFDTDPALSRLNHAFSTLRFFSNSLPPQGVYKRYSPSSCRGRDAPRNRQRSSPHRPRPSPLRRHDPHHTHTHTAPPRMHERTLRPRFVNRARYASISLHRTMQQLLED